MNTVHVYVVVYNVCYFPLCSEYNKKKQEWLLHEAELFAHNLLKNWDLGHCDEDVIVLYSQDDHVVSGI